MIINRVEQFENHVFGVYESESTSIMIHYENKGADPTANTSKAHLDVKEMFRAMEILDRRKGRS